jgi:hypothetical protein
MSDSQNMPLKIFHAFEDLYFEKDNGKIFDDIFSRYFAPLDLDPLMDLYDVLVLLSTQHTEKFEEMLKELKAHSLISD